MKRIKKKVSFSKKTDPNPQHQILYCSVWLYNSRDKQYSAVASSHLSPLISRYVEQHSVWKLT